jgi:hypothetical protein
METFTQKWWRVEGKGLVQTLLRVCRVAPLLLVIVAALKASDAAVNGSAWALVGWSMALVAGLTGVFWLTRSSNQTQVEGADRGRRSL